MTNQALEKALHAELDRLPPERQRQVLEFARAMSASSLRGEPGSALLHFAGTIPEEDLKTIRQAIAEGCEQVVPDEW